MKVESFAPIRLEEMDKVQLMNRTDRKFWFHISYLPELLRTIEDSYYILHIGGKSCLPYTTTYFDTCGNKMFSAHHNGKLNRFKIRKRTYVDSKIAFLEIKFKNNKGRTVKKRIPTTLNMDCFSSAEGQFIDQNTPYCCNDLQESLVNKFTRLTLVNKNFKERCTIDLDLQFEISNQYATLDNLVIVEIKSDGKSKNSPLALALGQHKIKESGFSKYCLGRSITDPLLKRNAFKAKLRSLEKVTNQVFI
ncbi:polyphosphate polymerase domain-containing protein [Marinifilum caeruleilacunae]|uniref:Polyphosphate polymerase domain-containing protein n=1 Tax=Marinifilum caeruleilacunae TaxID=2499076 RepID=A0ABX1X132_9BACT|nr:polyphosphate polymerase domain-containing protein [Marinifilum caeruleilacunae]NOU61926.1 polyphosphate polymerase domain-containing protein [Marinifilum caeruleilacunae]